MKSGMVDMPRTRKTRKTKITKNQERSEIVRILFIRNGTVGGDCTDIIFNVLHGVSLD